MIECPQGHCHWQWWPPPRAVLYFGEQPLLGKMPGTTATRGCEMSVGVSENVIYYYNCWICARSGEETMHGRFCVCRGHPQRVNSFTIVPCLSTRDHSCRISYRYRPYSVAMADKKISDRTKPELRCKHTSFTILLSSGSGCWKLSSLPIETSSLRPLAASDVMLMQCMQRKGVWKL
jgi:hypothetical protein